MEYRKVYVEILYELDVSNSEWLKESESLDDVYDSVKENPELVKEYDDFEIISVSARESDKVEREK